MISSGTAVLEVCCASPDFALAAGGAGADRVELCAGLVEGGLTPSLGALEATVQRLAVPVMVMVRPRGGDFLYRGSEVSVMLRDIEAVVEVGAHGVVFGALTRAGRVDRGVMGELIDAARGRSVTFHRAFDLSRDLDESLDALMELGVDRVLTSGGRPAVSDALDVFQRLAARGAGAITILPGGGVRPHDIRRLFAVPGIREVHVGASRSVASDMEYRRTGVSMGRSYEPDEYVLEGVDVGRVAAVAAAVAACEEAR